MENRPIPGSELVLTPDSEIYHLHLKPGDIGKTIFLVGDPGRVSLMSSFFDTVDTRIENREFVTHTGTYNNCRVSVISTGIGTDNIDIVINELDALVNIDLETRTVKPNFTQLNFIRLGTSGALHEDIEPGSVIVSEIAGGLDNLMHFYGSMKEVTEPHLAEAFHKHMQWSKSNSSPYFVKASELLLNKVRNDSWFYGITLSAPGFYAPQGRSLRMKLYDDSYIDRVRSFRHEGYRINNFEMEGSALYGLSKTLGHQALTICIALANRISGKFVTDYEPFIKQLLEGVLKRIMSDD
ncbi:MAG: nucleoside phosphorylase [Bacteroidales bacterium]